MRQTRTTAGSVLAKNTLINLSGMVLPLIVGIICIPFAIKGLGTEGFGIFSIVWVVFGYFSLLDFGLSKSTTKYVAEIAGSDEDSGIPAIVWTAGLISVILGVFGAVIILATSTHLITSILDIDPGFIDETQKSFQYTAIGLPVILISTSFQGVLGAAQRFDLVNLIFIPVSMLNFIIPALSYPLDFSLSNVVLMIVIVRVLAVVGYLILCMRVYPILSKRFTFDNSILPKLLSYGGWVTVTSIVSPILVYMDRFFIGAILSTAVVAYYTAPYDMINRLRILPIAIMKTLFPELSAMSYQQNNTRIASLFIRAIKYVLLPISVVSLLVFFFANEILAIWLGKEFAKQATSILRIISVGMILNSLAYIPFSLLQGVGRPDLPAKFHLAEFPVYIILMWVLTRNYGLNGAAFAWLIRISLDALLLYFFSIRAYNITLVKLITNKIFAEIIGLVVLFMVLMVINAFITIPALKIGSVAIAMLLFSIMIWTYIFDEKEKRYLRSLLRYSPQQ